jgi:hypothetical protein
MDFGDPEFRLQTLTAAARPHSQNLTITLGRLMEKRTG